MRALNHNERRILDEIRRNPENSRADIATKLQLSPALLTRFVSRFLGNGVVREVRETYNTRRGQPALKLSVCPGAVAGLGLSMSTEGLFAASLDLTGEIKGIERREKNWEDIDDAVELAFNALAPLISTAEHIVGLSIWVPAVASPGGGIAEFTPSQRALDYEELCAGLAKRLNMNVTCESRTTAIYEAMYSPYADRVSYNLFLNFGIGGSLIEGLRVIRGAFGQASNIGAMVPETGPRPSLPDLADALGINTASLDLDEIEKRTACNDPVIIDWIKSRGAKLSEPLSAVVHLFNPSAIVVSGLFPQNVIEGLIEHIDLGVYDLPGRVELAKPALRVGSLVGPDSMAISAAAVPMYRDLIPHHDGFNHPQGAY